jgi:hypothetical protein
MLPKPLPSASPRCIMYFTSSTDSIWLWHSTRTQSSLIQFSYHSLARGINVDPTVIELHPRAHDRREQDPIYRVRTLRTLIATAWIRQYLSMSQCPNWLDDVQIEPPL